MSKINLLSAEIYNKIAAGEVVERPSAVVKELVENSIDAGAENITIEIEEGGIKLISITDDGCGIESTDVKKAFQPHATSKITSSDDLYNISTLGFRGEALASIAAVSKIEMMTSTSNNDSGTIINLDGGELKLIEQVDCKKGCRITVKDLFFNTPARKKFLKKTLGETNEVTNIVEKLILANPNIAIKYYINNEIKLISQGKGIENAIFAVYGNNYLTNSIVISNDYKGIKVNGYISKIKFPKPNSTYQTIIVNGRYIFNETISVSIRNAYQPFLMSRNYPFYVVYIEIDNTLLDVNVHPNKLEVRFADNNSIFSAIYSPVKNALEADSSKEINSFIFNNGNNLIDSNTKAFQQNVIEPSTNNIDTKPSADFNVAQSNILDGAKSTIFNQTFVDMGREIFNQNPRFLNQPVMESFPTEAIEESFNIANAIGDDAESLIFSGKVFNTYLIFSSNSVMHFVDQHAAHERLLYDKFLIDYNSNINATQNLLIPYIFDVRSQEYDILSENIELLNNNGIGINDYGDNSFALTYIPTMLSNINLSKFVQNLLKELSTQINIEAIIKDIIAKSACVSAVKAGDSISEIDIEYLRIKLEENINLRCPHGRPIVLKLTKNEIDKMFKRIV